MKKWRVVFELNDRDIQFMASADASKKLCYAAQMNLNNLTGEALLVETKRLVADERRIGVEILACLRQVHRTRLFAERGYSSMHEFCIKCLGYSEGAAHRRIAALKVTNDMPEAEELLRKGKINFTTAATLHGFLEQEKRENQKTYSPEEKQDLLKAIEGQSKKKCEKLFATLAPKPAPQDKVKPLSASLTELRFAVDDELLKKLERIRALNSHKHANSSYAELLQFMADKLLERMDPELKPEQKRTPSPESGSRYVKVSVKRELWKRSGGRCEYVDPQTGRRCESSYKLQKDHLEAYAHGGSNKLENMRLVCAVHNQLAAIQIFGVRKMKEFVPGLS